jgi:membrane-bound ClpP family serine protease
MAMTWTIIVALISIGLLFLILEILVVPGTTVVGVVGFILMAIGIWQTYIVYGTVSGHYVLAGSLVLTLIALVLSLRSKTWNRAMLHTTIDSKVNVYDQSKIKVGDTGQAISRIVPMGKALFNDEYYEVRSSGDFIDEGTEIIISKIEHNKIFVKSK